MEGSHIVDDSTTLPPERFRTSSHPKGRSWTSLVKISSKQQEAFVVEWFHFNFEVVKEIPVSPPRPVGPQQLGLRRYMPLRVKHARQRDKSKAFILPILLSRFYFLPPEVVNKAAWILGTKAVWRAKASTIIGAAEQAEEAIERLARFQERYPPAASDNVGLPLDPPVLADTRTAVRAVRQEISRKRPRRQVISQSDGVIRGARSALTSWLARTLDDGTTMFVKTAARAAGVAVVAYATGALENLTRVVQEALRLLAH